MAKFYMNKKVIIGIVVGAIVIAGAMIFMANQKNSKVELSNQEDSKKIPGEAMTEAAIQNAQNGEQRMNVEENKMKSDVTMDSGAIGNDELLQQQVGSYKDYSPALAQSEAAAGNKVVLFFHAPWCPFCKSADSAFKTSLDKIPKGVAVLKTDYDSNLDLRKKYAVTYQHTFVQIDANGNQITKWTSGDIDMLIKNIK